VAARLGKPLYDWQRHVADVAGELDPATGLPAYDQVIVIGPRQIGKTELMLPVMTHRCIGFPPQAGPQTLLYTAQKADAARKRWRDVHLERLLRAPSVRRHLANPRDKVGGARLRQNQETIFFRNGSTWSPGATTATGSGTGESLDMGVIDEAWSRPDDRTELGMLPTMDTRPYAQLWVFSMIPGLSRALPGTWPYLKNKRAEGRARVAADIRYGMAFFDWSVPPDMDPADPRTWRTGHPGIDHSTTETKIRARFESLDLVDFEAEYLGIEPLGKAPRWTLLRQEVWQRFFDPNSTIQGARALSVEIAEDRSAAWVGIVGRRWDGDWHGAIAEPGYKIAAMPGSIGWLEPRVVELVEEEKPCTVVIDPRRPANSLIVPLRNRGFDVLTPNQNDIAGACGRWLDTLDEDGLGGPRFWHVGQLDLDRAVAGAKKLELSAGAFTLVKKGSAATISPVYTIILAMLGVEVKGAENPEPYIFG
jgi:hypothetical protein